MLSAEQTHAPTRLDPVRTNEPRNAEEFVS